MQSSKAKIKTIYFATSNDNKVKEIQRILDGKYHVERISIDLPELQGEPEEIAVKKAEIAYKLIKKPVIVEDNSLCFDALKGLPGPYVKHFMEKIGVEGILRLLEPYKNKKATSVVVIGYCTSNKKTKIFYGAIEGTMVSARGDQDWGWGIAFKPKGTTKTYGEMTRQEKDKYNARRIALEKFQKYLKG